MNQKCKWIISCLFGLLLLFFATPVVSEDTLKDKVAAVNGIFITQKDFDLELNQLKRRFAAQNRAVPDSQMAFIEKELVEDLINKELLYQASKKEGIIVEPSIVEDHLSAMRNKFPTQDDFERALKNFDLPLTDLKIKIQKGYAIQQLIDKQILANLEVSEKESTGYYHNHPNIFNQPEQVRASHILIKFDAGENKQAKSVALKRINEIRKKARMGEDFASLAEKYSEGPSKVKGGDLGYFSRGQMVKPFEDAAFALKPGSISGIVETRFGYHLIKVFDKTPERLTSYQEAKDSISRILKQKKMKNALQTYIETLRGVAKIERF